MSDTERVELNELCSGLVDEALTDMQRARLQDMLRASSEARSFYVRAMQLSASLHSYAGEMLSEPANVVRPAIWRRPLVTLAAAAAVMIGLLVGNFYFDEVQNGADEQLDMVARLTGSKDCEWKDAELTSGEEVASGQRLELLKGFAELTFDSGAQVVIEGPAILLVRSAWEAELEQGTLKANVPEEAIGFRVTNPAVEVVDLGTEFSVTAENGVAEVFVLKGSVEAHPKDAKGNRRTKMVLQENQAKRFAEAETLEVSDSKVKFEKLAKKVSINPIKRPLIYTHWSFDDELGESVAGAGSTNGSKVLAFEAEAVSTMGRFGMALQLNGKNRAQTKLDGAFKRGVRSVAFWTRIPEKSSLSDAGTITTVPTSATLGGALNLEWNHSPGEGVLGAMRIHSDAGSAVGSTDLRDGRWHHVAVVFGGVVKAGTKPKMKLYVDGRLENLTIRRGKGGLASRGGDKHHESVLWIGGSPHSSERFRGALDEFVVADQQLSPQQIRHLMKTNLLLSYDVITKL